MDGWMMDTSTKEVMFFHPCPFGCQQDYAKTTQQISSKLGGRMEHGPRKNPYNFGADHDKGAEPGMVYSFFNVARRGC